jgi:protease IV
LHLKGKNFEAKTIGYGTGAEISTSVVRFINGEKMKRNPWLVALTIIGALIVVVLVGLAAAMYTVFGDRLPVVTANSVMVIEVKGIITDSKQFIKTLQKYRDDRDVKAIVVRLDSPGGVVGPSQEMHDEILKTREMGKHVVASMGGVAASGAYYIAVACEKIYTNPGTITGSIGVIMEFANLEGIYHWAKVDRYVVKSGAYKDIGAEFRPMTAAERGIIQGMIDNVYGQFKRAVATGRRMKVEDVAPLADGRIFSGEQAVKNGLADELGGLQAAIDGVAKMAGIHGKPDVFYPPPHHKKLWDVLGGGDESDDDLFGRLAKKTLGLDMVGKPLFLMTGMR